MHMCIHALLRPLRLGSRGVSDEGFAISNFSCHGCRPRGSSSCRPNVFWAPVSVVTFEWITGPTYHGCRRIGEQRLNPRMHGRREPWEHAERAEVLRELRRRGRAEDDRRRIHLHRQPRQRELRERTVELHARGTTSART
jgi:hypothetical protein